MVQNFIPLLQQMQVKPDTSLTWGCVTSAPTGMWYMFCHVPFSAGSLRLHHAISFFQFVTFNTSSMQEAKDMPHVLLLCRGTPLHQSWPHSVLYWWVICLRIEWYCFQVFFFLPAWFNSIFMTDLCYVLSTSLHSAFKCLAEPQWMCTQLSNVPSVRQGSLFYFAVHLAVQGCWCSCSSSYFVLAPAV